MEIDVRKVGYSDYKNITVKEDNVSVYLEFLDEKEQKSLAQTFREAAFDLDNDETLSALRPGLEKALELVKDYVSDLITDGRVNEAAWVDVVRQHILDELEKPFNAISK